jgi:hypothetical protein
MQLQGIQLLSFSNYFKNKGGHWIDIDTHKVTKLKHIEFDSCWDHVNPDPDRHKCGKLRALFEAKSFIPSFCESCWKVVVTPRTLRELFALRDLMLEMASENPLCFCKCGIETRDWTPGKVYGGYFYNNSKEQGLKRWREVRGLVTDKISSGVNVILKRYCTEFEVMTGDSAKYQRPSNADEVEDMFFHIIENESLKIRQPEWALLDTYAKWILHGWRWGSDRDRRQIEEDHNDGKPLYNIPRTYHPTR